MKTGIQLIEMERAEQILKHGYDPNFVHENPQYYSDGQLAVAAEMLIASEHEEGIDRNSYPENWPDEDCIKMLNKPYVERLAVAGALIAAEIDRLNDHRNR